MEILAVGGALPAPPPEPARGLSGAEIRRRMPEIREESSALKRRIRALQGAQTKAGNRMVAAQDKWMETGAQHGFESSEAKKALKTFERAAEKTDASTGALLKATKQRRRLERGENARAHALLFEGKARQAPIKVEFATAVIRENKPLRDLTSLGKKEVAKKFHDASAFLRQAIRRDLPRDRPVYVSLNNTRDNIFYSRTLLGREGISVSELTDVRTYIHELGHWIEQNNFDWHQDLMQIFNRRTSGETAKYFSSRTTGGFNFDQMTKADKWFDKYVGVVNSHGGGNSELLSMSLEWLYARPFDFAEKDPELFDLIVALLDRN